MPALLYLLPVPGGGSPVLGNASCSHFLVSLCAPFKSFYFRGLALTELLPVASLLIFPAGSCFPTG